MNITPQQQHDIRNAVVCYKGIRRYLIQGMIAQMDHIAELDKQILRIEQALRQPDSIAIPINTPWYKKLFNRK